MTYSNGYHACCVYRTREYHLEVLHELLELGEQTSTNCDTLVDYDLQLRNGDLYINGEFIPPDKIHSALDQIFVGCGCGIDY